MVKIEPKVLAKSKKSKRIKKEKKETNTTKKKEKRIRMDEKVKDLVRSCRHFYRSTLMKQYLQYLKIKCYYHLEGVKFRTVIEGFFN